MILAFSALTISHANANNEGSQAKAITSIIMLLMSDDSVGLTIGQTNPSRITSRQNTASFRAVSGGIQISLTVGDLKTKQSIRVMLNGKLIETLNTNGNYSLTLPLIYLNSIKNSNNELTFLSSSSPANWLITGIKLLNSEGPHTRAQAVRFLTKATFGANESSIKHLLELGYESWVDEQLKQPSTLHLPFYQQAVIDRKAAGNSMGASQQCASKADSWWNGAIKGKDQIRQRMAFALSQILVVDDSACDSDREAFVNYYDILIKQGLGRYRDLLEDVTLNPIMASYLSLRGSKGASEIIHNDGRKVTTSPDENYAREVMQLFTIGLTELNIDGSEKRLNGRPIETYDNKIVLDTARALTGWQWESGRAYPGVSLIPMEPWSGLWARWHDHDEKTIINGVVIPAGDRLAQTGNSIVDDLKATLDALVAHNNIGPFISKQLIQRFVTSNPSPEYIKRVATVFNNNGSGIKGDLRAVIKAILLDKESIDSHLIANGGKLKEPLLRVSQIWRAFNAQSPIKYIRFMHSNRYLGQKPMAAGTVFNFYRPDYAPLGEILDNELVAPEYALLDDGQNLQAYWYMQKILSSDVSVNIDENLDYSTKFNILMVLNLTTAKSLANNTSTLLSHLNELLFGGLMSNGLRDRVAQYIDNEITYSDDMSVDERREKKVEEALFLLGVSPEFNVQQ